jgi:GTP-dependent phosphoenolpyruvate carboxykinase
LGGAELREEGIEPDSVFVCHANRIIPKAGTTDMAVIDSHGATLDRVHLEAASLAERRNHDRDFDGVAERHLKFPEKIQVVSFVELREEFGFIPEATDN